MPQSSDEFALSDAENQRLTNIVIELATLQGIGADPAIDARSNLRDPANRGQAEHLERTGIRAQVEAELAAFREIHGNEFDPNDSDSMRDLVDLVERENIWKLDWDEFDHAKRSTSEGPKRSSEIAEKLGVTLKDDQAAKIWNLFVAAVDCVDKIDFMELQGVMSDTTNTTEYDRAGDKLAAPLFGRLTQAVSLINEGREIAFKPSRRLLAADLQTMPVTKLEETGNMPGFIEGIDESKAFDGLTRIHKALAKPLASITQVSLMTMIQDQAPEEMFGSSTLAVQFDNALVSVNDLVKARLRRSPDQGGPGHTIEHDRGGLPKNAFDTGRSTDPSGGRDQTRWA